jgi:PilZ domain
MSASKKARDRRRWERLPLAIPVFVRGLDPNGRQFVDFATALDISIGGALLAIHRHLPRGSKIMIEIPSAPASHGAKGAKASRQSFYARAVRVVNGDSCHLMGLQFQKPIYTPRETIDAKPKSKRKSASSV